VATLKPILAKLFKGLPMVLAALVFLPFFLFVGLLILFAPVPQLVIHVRWCWMELGLPGRMILFLGIAGMVCMPLGFLRKRAALHRTGMLLFVVPIIGVAFHRVIAIGEWREISLLGAFLFTVLLIYLTTSVVVYGEENKKVVW
jgi:hypothetical protein